MTASVGFIVDVVFHLECDPLVQACQKGKADGSKCPSCLVVGGVLRAKCLF